MSDSNRVALLGAPETSYGVLASGAKYQDLRYVNENLVFSTESTFSDEVRSDRQVSDVVRNGISAGGPINVEMSYGTYDEFWLDVYQAAAWSSAVTPAAIANVSWTVTGTAQITRPTGSFLTDGFAQGMWIQVTDGTNPGVYKIIAASALALTVIGFTTPVVAGPESTTIIGGSQIVNGTTFRSWSFEKQFLDIAKFQRLYGMTFNGASFEATPQRIMRGTFDLVGKRGERPASTHGDGSPTAATTTTVMNSIDHLSAVMADYYSGGLNAAAPNTQFSAAITNNMRARLQNSTLGAAAVAAGRIEATGTFQQYFLTETLLDQYEDFTPSSVAAVLTDAAGNIYVFDYPSVLFTVGDTVNPGVNGDVIAQMEFSTRRHPVELVTARMVRFPAA